VQKEEANGAVLYILDIKLLSLPGLKPIQTDDYTYITELMDDCLYLYAVT